MSITKENTLYNKKILRVIGQLRRASLFRISGSKVNYPKVIQLPLTYECDSKCSMCNIWKMDHSNEASIAEFSRFMKDELFKKVESVGINGGEVSLIPNLSDYVTEIISLPSIRSINIISNGFRKDILLESIKKIYIQCKSKNISLHVAISLDGVEKIHDDVRGVRNAYKKATSTIDELIKNQKLYCDSYDIGCTVIDKNVNHLMALDSIAKEKKYNIKYRLGIENARIESDKIADNFSVLYSKDRQSAMEFFHYKYTNTPFHELSNKFKYFAIFYWLKSAKPKRLLGCNWREDGVTLDSRGDLYYCAVKSKTIGSLRKGGGSKQFFDPENISYRQSIVENECDSCIHDYSGKIYIFDLVTFYKYLLSDKLAMKIYKFKLRVMK